MSTTSFNTATDADDQSRRKRTIRTPSKLPNLICTPAPPSPTRRRVSSPSKPRSKPASRPSKRLGVAPPSPTQKRRARATAKRGTQALGVPPSPEALSPTNSSNDVTDSNDFVDSYDPRDMAVDPVFTNEDFEYLDFSFLRGDDDGPIERTEVDLDHEARRHRRLMIDAGIRLPPEMLTDDLSIWRRAYVQAKEQGLYENDSILKSFEKREGWPSTVWHPSGLLEGE
ncbi:hypothetical protein HGRIS_014607 [Hohenbuehelia grisea]|uniref:Uncharacterized protein n=1 Tax=Hohenbuehelia grisea TaxID=104357 RepID=A0ABR3JVY6_9AGAR